MYGDKNSFPVNYSGQFTMTTISVKSAFEGMGSAENGFRSASFDRFCESLDGFRSRVEAVCSYPKVWERNLVSRLIQMSS